MSHSSNIVGYLKPSGKFNKSGQKNSLSRNGSQKSLTDLNLKGSPTKTRAPQNAEESYPKKNRKYDQEEESLYQQRSYRNPIRKVNSISTSSEQMGWRLPSKLYNHSSEEEDEQTEKTPIPHHAKSTQNFQASRKEAKFFIESLARRVNIEIESISKTIDEFNKNFRRTVDMEYGNLRAAIIKAVEDQFEAEEQNIKNMAKIQIRSVNQQLSSVRDELEAMYGKLQKVKEGLDGPGWKKITGDILSGEIETLVQELIERSEKTKVLKNVTVSPDRKKEEAFLAALEDLMEVNLTSGMKNDRTFGIPVL